MYEGEVLLEGDAVNEEMVAENEVGPNVLGEEFVKALNGIHNGKTGGINNIFIEMIKFAIYDQVGNGRYFPIYQANVVNRRDSERF